MKLGSQKKATALALLVCTLAFLLVGSILPTLASPQDGPWRGVAIALGREGEDKDGVYRVTFPRTDLHVRVGGVSVRAGLALTSWAAFQKAQDGAMMMGDLVLSAPELATVLSKLSSSGIEVTAVHNHLLGEQPRVMYVHYHGHGDATHLARALREALAATGTPLTTPRARATAESAGPDAARLAQILGRAGVSRSGVVSISFPRAEQITQGRNSLGPRMGLATAINFQSDGAGVACTGDFVLLATEVQPVIRTLRENSIEVTAVHNHMLDEQPRLFFLHFWGRGETEKVARGLRAALDQTNHAK